MHFIDFIQIKVRAGDGGPGLVSFHRARNKPKLGPDGGDGGFGGDVILVANEQLNTLSSLRYNRIYKAEKGERGGPNGRTGRDGEDLQLRVPLGTVIYNAETNAVLGEVLRPEEAIIVAKGGKRGLGNIRFVSSIHQAPEENTSGGKGEELTLRLELKLLADVGFAGFPNAGKSTLLSRISAARPKVADYPFTTLVPHLGVVDFRDEGDLTGKSFVACDVPGLVEGASSGKGLGLAFLRHLERTKIIAYIVDTFSVEDIPPVKAVTSLQTELATYSEELAKKPALVILNKIDMAPDDFNFTPLIQPIKDLGYDVFCISAMRGDNLSALKWRIYDLVTNYNAYTTPTT